MLTATDHWYVSTREILSINLFPLFMFDVNLLFFVCFLLIIFFPLSLCLVCVFVVNLFFQSYQFGELWKELVLFEFYVLKRKFSLSWIPNDYDYNRVIVAMRVTLLMVCHRCKMSLLFFAEFFNEIEDSKQNICL